MFDLYKIIRTYIPIDAPSGWQWPGSKRRIVEMCPSLSKIIYHVQNNDPIGRVGNYGGVYEIGMGLEGYVPLDFSHPTLGQKGASEETFSISLSTYASNDISEAIVSDFVEGLADIHPWEHPVIEIVKIHLWVPS